MELKNWLIENEERPVRLAVAVGSSVAYIGHLAAGRKRCGERLAIEIEKATAGEVTVEELRPDVDWAYLRGSFARRAA